MRELKRVHIWIDPEKEKILDEAKDKWIINSKADGYRRAVDLFIEQVIKPELKRKKGSGSIY